MITSTVTDQIKREFYRLTFLPTPYSEQAQGKPAAQCSGGMRMGTLEWAAVLFKESSSLPQCGFGYLGDESI